MENKNPANEKFEEKIKAAHAKVSEAMAELIQVEGNFEAHDELLRIRYTLGCLAAGRRERASMHLPGGPSHETATVAPEYVPTLTFAPKRRPTKKEPSMKTMERWVCSGVAKATDGCKVEPDGKCSHGHESWLTYLGFM